MSLEELKQQLGDAILDYFNNAQEIDDDKCKEVAREALLLAAMAHVNAHGSDAAFIRMAISALEGALQATSGTSRQ